MNIGYGYSENGNANEEQDKWKNKGGRCEDV